MINDNNNWFYKVIKNVFRRWFLSYGLKVFWKANKGSVLPDFIIILTLFSGISILLRLLI